MKFETKMMNSMIIIIALMIYKLDALKTWSMSINSPVFGMYSLIMNKVCNNSPDISITTITTTTTLQSTSIITTTALQSTSIITITNLPDTQVLNCNSDFKNQIYPCTQFIKLLSIYFTKQSYDETETAQLNSHCELFQSCIIKFKKFNDVCQYISPQESQFLIVNQDYYNVIRDGVCLKVHDDLLSQFCLPIISLFFEYFYANFDATNDYVPPEVLNYICTSDGGCVFRVATVFSRFQETILYGQRSLDLWNKYCTSYERPKN